MSQILDEVAEVKNDKKIFSLLSFFCSIIIILIIIYIVKATPNRVDADSGLPIFSNLIIYLTRIFPIIGVIMTITSFARKEPSSWYKWIGGILNILLFVFLVGSILYARMIDAGFK